MKTKHVKIENKIATYNKDDGVIVCDNSDYEIEFSFDSEWDNYPDKKARLVVYANGRYEGVTVPIKGNVCSVPPVFNTKMLKVGAFVENAISTSTAAVIPCELSALSGKVKNLSGFGGGSSGGSSGGVSEEEVTKIVEQYLSQHPPKDGVSPTVEVTPIENGYSVTITDVNGTNSFEITNGKDYVLTEADKAEIANMALALLPDGDEVYY